jgi:hypothetical protein
MKVERRGEGRERREGRPWAHRRNPSLRSYRHPPSCSSSAVNEKWKQRESENARGVEHASVKLRLKLWHGQSGRVQEIIK